MCSLVIDWCSFFINVYTVSSSSRYLDNLIALIALIVIACTQIYFKE